MRRGPDLSVGGWLWVGFGGAALLLAAMVATAVGLLGRLERAEREQAEVIAPRAAAAAALEQEILRLGVAARSYALGGEARRRAAYQDALARVRLAQASLEALTGDGRATDVAEALALVRPVREAAEALVAVASTAPPPSDALSAAELALADRREEALDRFSGYVDRLRAASAEATAEILRLQAEARRTLLVAAAALLALLAATGALVARAVRGPALQLVEAAGRLAAGDHAAAAALASPPEAEGPQRNELRRLGQAFGRMALDLRDREERLLDQQAELQQQHEELQAQHEEIQSQNEELQAQQEELQSQNEELQAQQEELQTQADELRAHDDRLRRSEERYRHLFEHLSEGFALHEMIWDAAGTPVDYRFLEVNPAFERLTGVSRARAVGRTIREVMPDVEREWIERYGAVARTGVAARFEGFAGPLDRWFEVVAFRPEPGQFAVLFFDVTARRAAVEGLRDADRRKDEFLAVLSHELRNPLAPIVSGLEVLRRADPASDAAGRARSVIDRQVRHLVRLVDDLLDVTRITRGKVSLRRTRVDLVALVRQACEDNGATFADRRLALAVAAPDGPLWLDADPARIAQVVGNLLQNAAKFTPEGGTVGVSLEARGARAVLCVRDSGVGIRADVLPRLFTAFVQADGSLARTSGGLGLGLALVKGLTELHGGAVRAESEGEGRGAAFTVELPLVWTPAAAAAAQPDGAAPSRRVLVVEDNPDAADSLAEVLRLAGHDVEVARDGAEGLRRARERRHDVVLCDVGLPDIDGYEVARRLRSDGHRDALLVALTGYALPEDLRRAREAGFDAHVTKPARPEELEAVLARGPAGPAAGAA